MDPCEIAPCEMDPCEIAPCKMDHCKISPCKMDPCEIALSKMDPCKIDPCEMGLCKMDPCKFDPCKIDPCKMDPYKMDPCKIAPFLTYLQKYPFVKMHICQNAHLPRNSLATCLSARCPCACLLSINSDHVYYTTLGTNMFFFIAALIISFNSVWLKINLCEFSAHAHKFRLFVGRFGMTNLINTHWPKIPLPSSTQHECLNLKKY